MYEHLTDDQIEDAVFDQYRETASKEIRDVPEPERTIMAVYASLGVICNGGFAYFFENDFPGYKPYDVIIQSYKNLGFHKHAKAIEKMLSLFPKSSPHENVEERRQFMESSFYLNPRTEDRPKCIGEAEDLFFDEEKNIYTKCIEYLKNHT